jgi:hypothetical protein
VAYENQDFITHREYIGSPPACGGVRIAHLFSFLCCVDCCLFYISASIEPIVFVVNTCSLSNSSVNEQLIYKTNYICKQKQKIRNVNRSRVSPGFNLYSSWMASPLYRRKSILFTHIEFIDLLIFL